jgi:hypothetical protein
MMTYQFYRLDASGQILGPSIEIECDDDEMALAVGSAQIGAHVAMEILSYGRFVGRVAHAGIQDPPPGLGCGACHRYDRTAFGDH